MPNFDALRAGVVGPLAYMCKPEIPADLLALFPMDGSMNDLSRYGRTMSITTTPTYTTDGPLGKCAAFKGSFTHNQTTPFTIDFFANFPNSGAGNGNFFPNCSLFGSAGNNGGGIYGTTVAGHSAEFLLQITGSNLWLGGSAGTFSHFALTYDGTTLCAYIDGVRTQAVTVTLNPQSTIHLVAGNTKYCNLRVVGKCLASGSTFPVPSDFYTGFEPI